MSIPTPDELDRDQLDQLHAATLKASEACLELKKLCALVLVPAGTVITSFGDKRPGGSLFLAGFLVIAGFWVADGFSYYYQRKIRGEMIVILRRRARRCVPDVDDPPVIPASGAVSVWRAAFNASMTYYLILGVLFALAAGAYAIGWLDG